MKKRNQIIASCLLLLCLYLLGENTTVGVTNYTLHEPGLSVELDGFSIAHVSDLHNSYLWKQTILLLQQAQPDVICITGDLVDSQKTDVDTALAFAAEAVKIAPCYYVTGNHELLIERSEYQLLLEGLQELGICVLQNTTVDLHIAGQRIAMTGAFWGSSLYMSQCDQNADYRILLAHAPEEFDSYASSGFDLVLTGHAHGGQFRIPFLGGLYAPGQGIFPEYDSGVYTKENTDMVVSRGIGNSIIPVRIFNRPEVVIIALKSA